MKSLGETIRELRVRKKLPLRTVAAFLDIDQAILSKMERGQRKPKRAQVVALARYFKVKENDLLIAWLSDKLLKEVKGEKNGLEALQLAEAQVEYAAFKKIDRNKLRQQIKDIVKSFTAIKKAWIYGSFARGDDGPGSDIDIAVEADSSFSYFDLAEIQSLIENSVHRKVDVGFINSFKPYILEHIKPDLTLLYEKRRSF